MRIEFYRRSQVQQVGGSEWRVVLRTCSTEREFRISDFTICVIPFASWYMMNGGDLYELAKILGHSNVKMTERYAKLGRQHIARTGNTAREIWKLMERENADRKNPA